VDNDKTLLAILKRHLGADSRLTVACADGDDFLHSLHGQRLDFIFADTSAGEYHLLDEALGLLNPGGLYVIEEMLPQPNWLEVHAAKVAQLVATLEQRKDFSVTKLSWGEWRDACLGVLTWRALEGRRFASNTFFCARSTSAGNY
jgi:predicted O-methyltransferase YrrM